MTTKNETSRTRTVSPRLHDEQPLMVALIAEASRRGDTLAALAKALGVTYERLAQWRRNEGSIGTARRAVHEKAARYLGVPTVFALTMAGTIGLQEFVWPSKGSLNDRVRLELERMRKNPYIGPFVPQELGSSSHSMKLFAIFLFHELEGDVGFERPSYKWMTALHQAAIGDSRAKLELSQLKKETDDSNRVF